MSICIVTRFVQPMSLFLKENTSGYFSLIFQTCPLSLVKCVDSFSSTQWCSVTWAGERIKSESMIFDLCL